MSDYRAEVWFQYYKDDAEDMLEEMLREFLKQNRMWPQGGPVIFRIYPYPTS